MRVGVVGAAGRMGNLLVEEARAAGAQVAGLARPGEQPPAELAMAADLAGLAAVSDVVIDFTVAETAERHAAVLAECGCRWVLGTTGLSLAQEELVRTASRSIPVVYSANFSPGINLLLELAERMGAALPASGYDAEIVDVHHRQKVDAPSGTAVALGRAVAAGRGIDLAANTESGRDGHTGARGTGTIGFSAVRGGQVVGEHTLLFAGSSEHVALTHRVFDRRIFAEGAVRAAQWLMGQDAGLYSMRDVMRG